jgi:hypothetical protein
MVNHSPLPAFIVRAINAHDDLVAALREMIACYEATPESDKDVMLAARKLAAYTSAYAALAKAEGATP